MIIAKRVSDLQPTASGTLNYVLHFVKVYDLFGRTQRKVGTKSANEKREFFPGRLCKGAYMIALVSNVGSSSLKLKLFDIRCRQAHSRAFEASRRLTPYFQHMHTRKGGNAY